MTIKDYLLTLGKKEIVTIKEKNWQVGGSFIVFEGLVRDALKMDEETLKEEYEGPYDIRGVNERKAKCILYEKAPEKLLTLNDMRNEFYSSLSDYIFEYNKIEDWRINCMGE